MTATCGTRARRSRPSIPPATNPNPNPSPNANPHPNPEQVKTLETTADVDALVKTGEEAVVVVYAPWCQFCQAMAPGLEPEPEPAPEPESEPEPEPES